MPPLDRHGASDFLRSPANEAAAALVLAPERWPSGRLALTGPAGAGKTHLARIAASVGDVVPVAARALTTATAERYADARLAVVEDVPAMADPPALERREAEEGLFHLYNLMAERGGRLLVTGRGAPVQWPIAMPDLASRLGSLTVARIGVPDDALLSAVLLKHGADRGLDLAPAAVTYVLCRIERSFAAAATAAAAIDRVATRRRRRKVTQQLATEALASLAEPEPETEDAGSGAAQPGAQPGLGADAERAERT